MTVRASAVRFVLRSMCASIRRASPTSALGPLRAHFARRSNGHPPRKGVRLKDRPARMRRPQHSAAPAGGSRSRARAHSARSSGAPRDGCVRHRAVRPWCPDRQDMRGRAAAGSAAPFLEDCDGAFELLPRRCRLAELGQDGRFLAQGRRPESRVVLLEKPVRFPGDGDSGLLKSPYPAQRQTAAHHRPPPAPGVSPRQARRAPQEAHPCAAEQRPGFS